MYSNLSETVQDYMCAEACTDAVCWISLGHGWKFPIRLTNLHPTYFLDEFP